MSDIECRVCGEPYDVFGLSDPEETTPEEKRKVMSGVGCWACGWGETCAHCRGRKHEPCHKCHGNGKYLHVYPYREQADPCDHCNGTKVEPDLCFVCGGTGKPVISDERHTHALYSLMNSDEDVSVYL